MHRQKWFKGMTTAALVVMVVGASAPASAFQKKETYRLYAENGFSAYNKYSNPYSFNFSSNIYLKDESDYSQVMDAETRGAGAERVDAKFNRIFDFNQVVQPKETRYIGGRYLIDTSIVDYEFVPENVSGWGAPDSESQYLEETDRIELSDPWIQRIADQLYDALTAEEKKNPYYYTKKVYEYVQQNMQYTIDTRISNRGASHAVNYLVGDCEDYSSLMVALLRTKGIASKTVTGYSFPKTDISSSNLNMGAYAHMWVEAYFEGYGYVLFDPTLGSSTSKTITVKDREGNNFLSNGSPVTVSVRNPMATPTYKTFGKNVNLYIRKEQGVESTMTTGASYLTISRVNFARTTNETALVKETPVEGSEITLENVAFQSTPAFSLTDKALQIKGIYSNSTQQVVANEDVTFESSDPSIATISAKGILSFSGETGSVTIKATVEDKSVEKTITVSRSLAIGQTLAYSDSPVHLSSAYTYMNGERLQDPDLTWSSSDEDVATVDANGNVSFSGKTGEVTISATNLSTGEKDDVSTTVSRSLEVGGTLTYSSSPKKLTVSYAYGQVSKPATDVVWTSSDEDVATVDADGEVTFSGRLGKVVITATDIETGAEKSKETTVAATLGLSGSLSYSESTQTLTGAYNYSEGIVRQADDLEWSSSDTNVATVDDKGVVSYTGQPGTVRIEAYSPLTGETKSKEVTVSRTLSMTGTLAYQETPLHLGAKYRYDGGVVQDASDVTWSSSDESIATVDADGVVSFTGKAGEVSITVENAALQEQVTQTVVVPVSQGNGSDSGNSGSGDSSGSGNSGGSNDTGNTGGSNDSGNTGGSSDTGNIGGGTTIPSPPVAFKEGFSFSDLPQQLQLTGLPEGAVVTYVSTNPKVATVDSKGVLRFTGEVGYVDVKASVKGSDVSVTKRFSVSGDLDIIGKPSYDKDGQTLKVHASYSNGKEMTPKGIKWTSSNPSVATVSDNGKVTYTGKLGAFTLTATTAGATLKQTVKGIVSAKLSAVAPAFDAFQAKPFVVSVDYGDGKQGLQKATYSSSNKGIATIDSKGVVRFNGGLGKVTLTAKDAVTGLTTARTMEVKGDVEIPRLAFNPKAQHLEASIRYANGQRIQKKNLLWTSSNPSVAKTTLDGHVSFTGKSGKGVFQTTLAGKKVSVPFHADGALKLKQTLRFRYFDGVYLGGHVLMKGKTKSYVTTADVSYKSSNPSVATVTSTGYVRFTGKEGKVSISVLGAGKKLTTSTTVTRKLKVYKTLKRGSKTRLSRVAPILYYTGDKTTVTIKTPISYASSNPSVVRINQKGYLTHTGKKGVSNLTIRTGGKSVTYAYRVR